MQNAYQELEGIFRQVQVLRSVAALLRWDAEVMMPKNSHLLRAEQLATLQNFVQELAHSPKVAKCIKIALHEKENLDPWQRTNLDLMIRQYQKQQALSHRFIHKLNNAIRVSESAWLEAKETGNFAVFTSPFEKLLNLVHEKAKRLSDVLHVSPYEALMDEYDPKRKQSEVDVLLNQVKGLFPGIIQNTRAYQTHPFIPIMGKYPKRKQMALCKELLKLMHFPMKNGRLDESVHPFTEGAPPDIRITTIFDRQNPLQTLMGLMHELGHALYDASLPQDHAFQLVGHDAGMVIHEGIALFWEKIIGQSMNFTHWLSQYLQSHFENPHLFSAENIYGILTQVNPRLPRMDADEVCYLGHIIIRYEIEKALFAKDIKAKDIPAIWAEKTKALLGVQLENPALDCLQDIHWAQGYFGYFHAYGLGFLFSTQLYQTLQQAHPEFFVNIHHGNFVPLLNWLKENLFQWGAKYNANELVVRITGQPLKCEPYVAYLQHKYRLR